MILTSLMLQIVSYLLPFYRSSGSRCRLSDHTFGEQRVYILSGLGAVNVNITYDHVGPHSDVGRYLGYLILMRLHVLIIRV